MKKMSGIDSNKAIKEEAMEKDSTGHIEQSSKSMKIAKATINKEQCKSAADSIEVATTSSQAPPHSPSQPSSSSSPIRNEISPTNNGNPDSCLTPPPPSSSLPIISALSLSVDPLRSYSDLQHSNLNSIYPGSGKSYGKTKKFLRTLIQFGNEISQDIGDRSSNISIEEFHNSLQEITNFPVKPFVLPFLKAHIPLLQREIQMLAKLNKQSALQYVRVHENIIFEPNHSPSDASEIFMTADTTSMKRRSFDGFYENGINGSTSQYTDDYIPPNKKTALPLMATTTSTAMGTAAPAVAATVTGSTTSFPFSHHHNFFLANNALTNTQFFDYQSANNSTSSAIKTEDNNIYNKGDEEWKNIHVMLNCILSMVEKTKRALLILQQRHPVVLQEPTSEWIRKQNITQDLKKVANEILNTAVRTTEERVAEIKRRAEEAVSDVKRQAVLELQRAIAVTEVKAGELLAAEREKVLGEVKKHAEDGCHNNSEYADNMQLLPSQPFNTSQQTTCWNCGRKAHDTCSGCNVARYCGPFCQHKDWENHHQICNKEKRLNYTSVTTMTATSSTTTTTATAAPNGANAQAAVAIGIPNTNVVVK